MFTVMLIFHTLICILLVIVILMQAAKGEGLAGAFGGGGGGGLSGAVFGGRGAGSFLSRATTVIAIVFMVNCGILAFMSSRQTGGLSDSATSIVVEEAQKELDRQTAQQQAFPPTSGNSEGSLFPTSESTTDGGSATGETPTEQPAEPVGSGE